MPTLRQPARGQRGSRWNDPELPALRKPTLVPTVSPSASPTAPQELTDLQRKLKENESQRTEVTGYINQLSIQLHRWKLRLQTLNERKTELEEELRKPT